LLNYTEPPLIIVPYEDGRQIPPFLTRVVTRSKITLS